MRREYPLLGREPNPLWKAVGVIVSLGMFAILFVLGLVVLAMFAGVVAVGLLAWWIRSWWYRRRFGAVSDSSDRSGNIIVAEYTVVERRQQDDSSPRGR